MSSECQDLVVPHHVAMDRQTSLLFSSLSSLYRTQLVQVVIGVPSPLNSAANHVKNLYTAANMSYQKPEKDFGEGPVRTNTPVRKRPNADKNISENPQNPHHLDLPQSAVFRESLSGADRARQVQRPSRQGSCPSAHEELEGHHEEDTLW